MTIEHRVQIGVMGSWRNNLKQESYLLAEQVGKQIAESNYVLFSGGSTGVMEYAMKGCHEAGGTNVGIIPASDFRKYDYLGSFLDIKINTGMDESGRIPTLINSCDGIIAIGGGVGTLTEVCHAYHQGKPVVVMKGTGHVSDKLEKLLDSEGYLDTKKLVKIHLLDIESKELNVAAKEAVDLLVSEILAGQGKDSNHYSPEHGKRYNQ